MREHTPWGEVQGEEVMAEGIKVVYTASHGGIVLSDEKARKLNGLKSINFLGSSKYWEEDCDWAIPFVAFAEEIEAATPKVFFEKNLSAAIRTIEFHHKGVNIPRFKKEVN